MTNSNADIGKNVEILFRNSIGNYPDVIDEIKRYYRIRSGYRTAIISGRQGDKADVKIEFENGYNIDANIKSVNTSARAQNQLTRKKIAPFCELFALQSAEKLIKDSFVARARKQSKQSFSFDIHATLQPLFRNVAKKIVKWSFSYKQSREILVLFDSNTDTFYIYSMKEVLNELTYGITFSPRAGNIEIGKYVFIQRKAGNGKRFAHMRKDDLNHPGNDIQVKLKSKLFIEDMKHILLASYTL